MTYDESERIRWVDGADAYAKTFGPLCAGAAVALLDAAGVGAGTSVLDVGTGTGTVAALAFQRGARVTAVDAEPSMVAATAARLPGADVRPAILPGLPFPDAAFDAVVANFVLNHVGDPAAAVAALTRVARPGGRVAVTVWPHPAPTAQALWTMVYRHAGVEVSGLIGVDPAKNFPRTVEGVTGLLGKDLTAVTCERIEWIHETTPDAWWGGAAAGLNATGVVLRRQTPAGQARIRASFDAVTEPFRTEKGLLRLPTAALVAQGLREVEQSTALTLK
ncbi:class I SAM-dependent methyltransferase [Actinoplanes sp. NPDC051343]|jgi:ubiquinone/menaquinone biosynthesis C-methylase UbiE|uniref:class I SAM-dependent methyltransferase n=1 Tax=Actinoplanes sp. NPDC051343 TaxID=3363906 RepID=UPI0037AE89D4